MRKTAVLPLVLLLAATPLAAQQPIPLTVDRPAADSLGPDDVDAFTLELAADRFVAGSVDQQTMDVVVTVRGPDGGIVRRTDVTARGAEHFQFEAEAAGTYRIEISPFERQTGRYVLEVRTVEPIATEPGARVDQIMAAFDGPDVPGGVVGVVRDGRLTFARAYGFANLAHDIPFDVDTRTNIGSTSKQFTAFAIALLAERGELSLDDDVREYIPELPDFGTTVTLRHLMTHTSGYREFLNTLALAGRRIDRGDHVGRDEVIAIVQNQPELQNEPGAEFNYNNTAFVLLTVVVERVTGQPFADWMRDNVFAPLLMEHTFVRADPGQVIENSAQGYSTDDEGEWREARDLGSGMGPGGIYTTIGDLARWVRNYRRGALGGPALFDRMTTRYVLTTGDTTEYGFGLVVDEYRGLRRIQHGGADVAHRAMLAYYPDIDAAVIALSNNAGFDPGGTANRLTDVFFEEHLEPRADDDPPAAGLAGEAVAVDTAAFDRMAGRFAIDAAPHVIVSFFREGETLYTQIVGQPRIELAPTSDSTFDVSTVDASVTFHRDATGRADSVTLHQNGNAIARRLPDMDEPTTQDLAAYTGRYYSPELETYYVVELQDDALVLRHRRFEEPIALTPAGDEGAFAGGFPVARVEFTRDDAGRVSGLLAGNGRTRDVRFDRLE